MALNSDIQRGVIADFDGSPQAAADACKRASAGIKNVDIAANNGGVRLTIKMQTLGQAWVKSNKGRTTVINVPFRQQGERLHLETELERWTAIQSKIYGFIPAGPKRLWGKELIFRFYNNLENEIWVIDPNATVVQREPKR